MDDTTVSSAIVQAQASPSVAREWLLLTHHLPAEPGYFRVKVRRRLEAIGAVALKNSVYVLPPGEDTREDFEWLKREIEKNGGESTLCSARFLDRATDERLIASFRAVREPDYVEIAQAAREFAAAWAERAHEADRRQTRRQRARLWQRLAHVVTIDFFGASGRDSAEATLSELEGMMRGEGVKRGWSASGAPEGESGWARGHEFVGRTWVTRRGAKVDRMASAWLIRRFVDPAASFEFVDPEGYRPRGDELRFDMFEGEFTHEGDACTFEVLAKRFAPDDAALARLGEIVHDIDFKDDTFGHPEVAGVASLVDGIIRLTDDDQERLERGAALFEQLYEHASGSAS